MLLFIGADLNAQCSLTSGAGTDAQTKCINTAITNITYTYTGATSGSASGLPAGVSFSFTPPDLTISGTPTAAGTFSYTVNLSDGTTPCNSAGTINVTPLPDAAGSVSGSPEVCKGQTGVSYSVGSIAGATSYTWSYSGSGATISGSTNTVTIDFAAGATSGDLTVYGVNGCGNGTASDAYSITVNSVPAAAGTISGSVTACQGASGVAYSVGAISGATSYLWSYSGTGASINGSGNSVTVDFATNATAGSLTVYGTNTCGSGTISPGFPVTVNLLPAAAGSISGTATVCQGQSGVSYSVGTISSATGYSWSYSGSGASIVGTGSSITINFSASATSGNLTVRGSNTCGLGTVSPAFAITLHSRPTPSVSGPAKACITSTSVYLTESGMTGYTWNLPSGGTLTPSGNQATVVWNSTPNSSRTVTVNYTDGNGCTAATPSSQVVNVIAKPMPGNVAISGIAREYATLTVSYDYNPDVCFPEDPSQTLISWYWYNNASGGSRNFITTKTGLDKTFTVPNNIDGKYVEAVLKLHDGAELFSEVASNVRVGPIAVNEKPTATPLSVSGTYLVNNMLDGDYVYADAESDPESGTTFEWWRANDASGSGAVKITGATAETYTLTTNERNKYIRFKVTPKSSSGTTPGDQVQTGWTGPVSDNAPVAGSVSISGSPVKVGKVLIGSYQYSDTEGDTEGSSQYQWYTGTNSVGAGSAPLAGANSISYQLTNAEIGKYIGFSVVPVAQVGSSPGTMVTTTTWVGPVTNDPPVATINPVTGSLNVGGLLTGNYVYSDAEGDIQGGSTYQWSSSPVSGGIFNPIAGETGTGHIITMSEQGYYFKFSVTPRAATGTVTGSTVTSPEYGPANSKPVASAVIITGTASIGSLLSGFYSYSDPDGDLQGTSTFRWLRNGTTAIPGATSLNYTVTSADEGFTISLEVTPVSSTGFPNTGNSVLSSPTSAVIDPSPLTPVATEVCIEGIRAEGQILRGKYLYTFYKSEGASTYKWYRNGVAIPGATSVQYTLTAADMETNTDITFEVTPRSSNIPAKTGSAVTSNPLARIIIPKDEYSVAEKDVLLNANVAGGVFSGNGVTGNIFSPKAAGASLTPYTLTCLLNIINTNYNCSQQATRQVLVNPNYSAFSGFNTIYCHDNGPDNISVLDVPSGATLLGYKLTDPKGLISQSGLNATIDPGKMRPGAGKDSIYFSYIYNLTYYEISQPFIIDSVSTGIRFLNLSPAYCASDDKVYVTVEGVYPPNGTATWTGGILSDPKPASVFVDPSLATPGTSYPITYRYRSQNGCYSKILSNSVKVNPLPNPSFPLNATYNIEGGPVDLVPVQNGGKFFGNGVSGNKLFPDIAGTGTNIVKYIITDNNNCTDSLNRTTIIRIAQGVFNGIPAVICYDTITYNISVTGLPPGITITGFTNTKNSLAYTMGETTATYSVPAAGKGEDTLSFTYKWDGVDYRIRKALLIDSLGQAVIKNLAPGEKICDNIAPYELFPNIIGGVFTGPVSGTYLDPTKALGPASVSYVYTNIKTGCSTGTNVPVTIYPAPRVTFATSDVCIQNDKDTTIFINNTTSADKVESWKWEFVETAGSTTDTAKNARYLYRTGGLRKVILTATTINNCPASRESTIDIGVRPEADFYWKKDCYHPNDSIVFVDTTFSGSPIASRSWRNSSVEFSSASKYAPLFKSDTGYLHITYIVRTAYANCNDTVNKDVYVRPAIAIQADGYYQDFESAKTGWVKDELKSSTWVFGKPDGNDINAAASGNRAWFTNLTGSTSGVEQAGVISPCFDFIGVSRPLVKLNIMKRFERDRDGAVLQFRIGDERTWQNVGTINDDGIEWYNSSIIKGEPGNSTIGWTSVGDPEESYLEALHTLDELIGKSDVRFRISYGTNGAFSDHDGFAFDDFWLGDRTRKALLEHFTNISNSSSANSQVNLITNNREKDIINIQYHTNFPQPDPYYADNPGDASARFLFYGLLKAPFTFTDGGTNVDYAYVNDYVKPLDTIGIIRRTLQPPSFIITLNTSSAGGILNVSADIKALEDLNEENLTLYIAVTEKKNSQHPSGSEPYFYNVFRKFIPDAAGTNLKKTWTRNETLNIPEKSWTIEKIQGSSDIEVVAFIQNNITKEIYQAASVINRNVTVGVEKLIPASGNCFSIYPNPTSGKLTIEFEKELPSETDIRIYDFSGTMARTYKAGKMENQFVIEDAALKNGIYLIRISSGGLDYGFKKLVISGR